MEEHTAKGAGMNANEWTRVAEGQWRNGPRAIYYVGNGYVISENDSWLPGAYATFSAAAAAFLYSDDVLAALRNDAIATGRRKITLDDLTTGERARIIRSRLGLPPLSGPNDRA